MVKTEKNKKILNFYGWIILALYLATLVVLLVVYGGKILLPWNDNLDSNIALNKMYHDNNFLLDRKTEVPFLGGVSRGILTNGYNLEGLIYGLFPTGVAYALIYLLHVIFSASGFWQLGRLAKKYEKFDVDENICIICGIVYSMLGAWPSAYIGFSLLPWWFAIFYLIYATKRKRYIFIFAILSYNTSFVLLGVFVLFYLFVFSAIEMIRNKRINKITILTLIAIVFFAVGINIIHLKMMFNCSSETTKGLVQSVAYTDGFKDCVKKLYDLCKFEASVYHSGLYSLKYIAIPAVIYFFFVFNFEKKDNIEHRFRLLYNIICGAMIFNCLAYAFDDWNVRRFIPLASGFSFSRFLWLNPFFVMVCVAIIVQYYHTNKYNVRKYVLLIVIPITIVFDFDFTLSGDMYNIIHINAVAKVSGYVEYRDEYWSWKDFYATDLFNKIKDDIGYDNEWAIAYGLDPAVLQYNGIYTLDGYYSNYDKTYYDKWEQLMQPEFQIDSQHYEYWQTSGGIRAYVYSPYWGNPCKYDISSIGEAPMYIDKSVLKELQGKYVFSRVEVSNKDELNFEYLGVWQAENSPYTIYVYKVN